MFAIPRIVSVFMASATATGLIVAIGLAPSAAAAQCTTPESNATPPPGSPMTAPDHPGGPPTGRKPRGANEHAPLPKLGPLISALIQSAAPHSAPIQEQAGVVPPVPNPPGAGNQAPASAVQPKPNAAPAQVAPAADPGAAIAGSRTSLVEFVSGANSPNRTLQRFGISGTDLGIMWDNGDPSNDQVLMAFGDTVGYCSVPGRQWRYNTLLRSQDRSLAQGIAVQPGVVGNKFSGSPMQQPNFSKQPIPTIRWAPDETGIIPTAGIAVGTTQFVNIMSIKNWGRDGEWSTNYSALAVSKDNGENWGVYPGTIRTAAPGSVPRVAHVPGNENFQQGAFVKFSDGYLYSFGTPAGRGGPAFVARVPQSSVPDLTKYQYWNADNSSWVPNNPAAATPVIPGPVGEMSVQYNTYLQKYLALYSNGANDIAARTAPAPQGPWSPEQVLVSSMQVPGGIYGPFLHPWSTGKDVYFNLSLWSDYNVMLMHTVLQ